MARLERLSKARHPGAVEPNGWPRRPRGSLRASTRNGLRKMLAKAVVMTTEVAGQVGLGRFHQRGKGVQQSPAGTVVALLVYLQRPRNVAASVL